MIFTKAKKIVTFALTFLLVFMVVGIFAQEKVYALEATDTVEYPFAAGDYALANAPTVTALQGATTADTYQWYEQQFDAAVDLTSATYVAIEIEMLGAAGFTVGVMSNGQRFGSYVDEKPYYFVKEDGSVTQLASLYASVTLSAGLKGALFVPLSSLSIVSWGDQKATLSSATSFFFETNAKYNHSFSFKVGEVAYYTGDPVSASATKALDLSKEVKPSKHYTSNFTVVYPSTSVDTTKDPYSFTYPMRTGEDALVNAPTITAMTESEDSWQWTEHIFDTAVDLSEATYVAVEFAIQGAAGFQIGVISEGTRFGSYIDGNSFYFTKEDGTVTELKSLYSSVTLEANAKGTLLIPLASLSIVSWGNQEATLGNATSIFFETNALYNRSFTFNLGEVAYYTTDPFTGGMPTKVLDLSKGVKKAQTSVANGFTVTFPESKVDTLVGLNASYPFRKGEKAFEYSMVWAGPSVGDTADNWQTLRVSFDNGAADLSNATYIAVQYWAKNGAPGLTYGLQTGGLRHSIVGSSGEEIYLLKEDGSIASAGIITYDALATSAVGCLLIPMSYFKYQFGTADEAFLSRVDHLMLATNSRYNWAFEVGIGEVGYYTGQIADDNFTYHSLVEVDNVAKESQFTALVDNAANPSTLYVHTTEQMVYGDTTLVWTATGKTANSMAIWDGGAGGSQTMTTDSYGDDAVLLTSTGPREGADAYTAVTIADGVQYDWSAAQGVTMWVKNEGTKEIAFNFEMDVTNSSQTGIRGRFNVQQGHRFWLYDVNTGKQTIYMTRPTVTIPVGFEGWVRIPFTAFAQAEWSVASAGAFPMEHFMTEGSLVHYVCVTIYSGDYTNQPFALNKIGSYTTTPVFVSALVPASDDRKDIAALMGLR